MFEFILGSIELISTLCKDAYGLYICCISYFLRYLNIYFKTAFIVMLTSNNANFTKSR